jgi:hypothetical protein
MPLYTFLLFTQFAKCTGTYLYYKYNWINKKKSLSNFDFGKRRKCGRIPVLQIQTSTECDNTQQQNKTYLANKYAVYFENVTAITRSVCTSAVAMCDIYREIKV